jgi:hypothetical protein
MPFDYIRREMATSVEECNSSFMAFHHIFKEAASSRTYPWFTQYGTSEASSDQTECR